MKIRPIWQDRQRCEYPPVFVSGLLVGLCLGLALASTWWWEMVQ